MPATRSRSTALLPLAVDFQALRPQQGAQRRGRRRDAPGKVVLGKLPKLPDVIGGGPDECLQLIPQVAEVARDQLEPGGTLGGELGRGQAADQQQQRQGDGGDAEGVPSGQRPCSAPGHARPSKGATRQ